MKSGVSIRDKDPADSTFDRPNLYPEESGRCDFYTLDVSDLAFGWLPVVEVDAKGVTAAYPTDRSYCWGLDATGTLHGAGGVGGLLLTTDGTRHHIPLYDANGNVQGLINAGTGSLEAVYCYSAFGELLGYKNPVGGTHAQDNPIRFASKYYDSETGLYQYNHRFYSPKLGRFITRDPVGEYGGLNLYAYCANRPVDRWDHLGQFVDGGATLYLANALFSMFENIVLGKIFGGRPDRPKMFDTYTDTWRAGARFADTFGGLGTPVQLRHGPLARGCHAAEDKDKDKEAKEERRTEDAAQQNERVARVAVVLVERSIYFAKGYTEDGLTVQESIVGSGEYLSRECDDCYLEGDDFSTREELEALVRYHRSRDAVVVVVIVGHGESYIQDGNEMYGIQLIFQSEKDGIHQTLKADELDKLAAQLLEGEIAMSTVMCKSYWDTRVISNAVQIVREQLEVLDP